MLGIRSDQLKSAIDNLYRVFSRYKLLQHIDGCKHCVSDKDHALIHSLPLKQLGTKELAKYAFKAMTTWGSEHDFKHFLPRIFQLISIDAGGSWIDPEVVFGKLDYAKWYHWPENEQAAIRQYLHAIWLDTLSQYPGYFPIESCLCCIGQVESDIRSYLKEWADQQSIHSIQHLADLMTDTASRISNKSMSDTLLRNAWWDCKSDQAKQVLNWLAMPERNTVLDEAFFDAEDDDQRVMFSKAVGNLELIQNVLRNRNS